MFFMSTMLVIVEKNVVPDFLVRRGIQKLLASRLAEENKGDPVKQKAHFMEFVKSLKKSPIAIETRAANDQHYELPPEFMELCLGKNLKYSCCYFPSPQSSLDDAEDAMLELYCERAQIKDGMDVLDMGCGWGSFSVYAAKKFPKCKITGVSNSKPQREYILGRCAKLGLTNVEIITCDMNVFSIDNKFDRVVSIEMFEHMKNYQQLMAKVAGVLKPDGRLFVHIFTHKEYAYHFEAKSDEDFMSRYFFTGGTMPSDDLLLYFQDDLAIEEHWRVNGKHYGWTCDRWLENLDKNKSKVWPLLEATYGKENATKWFVYWRLFFMAVGECYAYADGNEWIVSHYLFKKK